MRIPEPVYRLTGQLNKRYDRQWRSGRYASVLPWNIEKNAIFIHIPKTAGTSLLQVMGINPPADHLTHATAAVYQRMHPDLWRSAYKVTFVRDPADRLASAFYFLQNKTDWRPQVAWANKHLRGLSYEDFLAKMRRNPWYRSVVMSQPFFWPQSQYLRLEKGYADLDGVFYFEDLEAGARTVCKRLGIPWRGLTHARKTDRPRGSKELDPRDIRLIHRLYRRDYEMFGYPEPRFIPTAQCEKLASSNAA